MRKYLAYFFLLLSGFTFGQSYDLMVHANGLGSSTNSTGYQFKVRVAESEKNLVAGFEIGGVNWAENDGSSSYYLTVSPFGSLRSTNGNLTFYTNLGPSIAFALGDISDEQNSLDLGVEHVYGLELYHFLIEYSMRIGYRQYSFTGRKTDFSRFSLGIGYRF